MEKMVVDNDLFFSDVLQVLEQGRRVTIPVKGFSMLPFIRGGKDLVVLEKAGEDLSVDDIVLFHVGPADGGRYVMHRIMAIDGDHVDIMGDGVPRTTNMCAGTKFSPRRWKSSAAESALWTRTPRDSAGWYTFGSGCARCGGISCSSTATSRGT